MSDFHYSREKYNAVAANLFAKILKDGGMQPEDFAGAVICDNDSTFNRFQVHAECYGYGNLTITYRMAVQFMLFDERYELAVVDLYATEGDQFMYCYHVDMDQDDVLDMATGEVMCRI